MTVAESAEFAKENVPEYKELNADDQARVRRLIRQAKANGFTDKQMRYYARVASRSGIDIVIDKESLRYTDKKGRTRYADGLYSLKRNKIKNKVQTYLQKINEEAYENGYVDRELFERLRFELDNDSNSDVGYVSRENLSDTSGQSENNEGRVSSDNGDRGVQVLTSNKKALPSDENSRSDKGETTEGKTMTVAESAEFAKENVPEYKELNAHYIEALFDDDALLEKLCNDNPTLPDKILSFFKKAITGYSDEPNLSREAKKLYKRYKTLFDSFSVRNQYGEVKGDGGTRYSISSTLESDLDLVLSGKFDASKGEIYIGETSNFLTKVIEAESLPLYMSASKAYSAMVTKEEYDKNPYYSEQQNYHGIDKKDFIKILNKSELPEIAFVSPPDENGNKRQNRVVLVTDEKISDIQNGGKKGYAVVVEEVDATARSDKKKIKANKTITLYPKIELFEDVQLAIIENRILYISKKENSLLLGDKGPIPKWPYKKLFSKII